MKYSKLRKKYNTLQQEVHEALKKEIENSKDESKHTQTKVLKVNNLNIYNYREIGIINDTLTFMDVDGYQYGIYCNCSLEDLIDILIEVK